MQRALLHVVEPVARLSSDETDREGVDVSALRRVVFVMQVIRDFELALLAASREGNLHGPVHTSIGQEVVPSAVLLGTSPRDLVFGGHRSHHHLLATGLLRLLPAGWDPERDDTPARAAKFVAASMAEIVGRRGGLEDGVGGSMHLRAADVGFAGTSAIVGGTAPLACGAALAGKLSAAGGTAVCFLGDGAVNQGVFHEAANLAGLMRLPVLFVVENNGYAEATRPVDASAVLPLASQGAAHGLRSLSVDGDDVLALLAAGQECWQVVREEGAPALLEVVTYRHRDHTGDRPGSDLGYRGVDEEQRWLARDPLGTLPAMIRAHGGGDAAGLLARAGEFVQRVVDEVAVRPLVTGPLDSVRLVRGLPSFPTTVRGSAERVDPPGRVTFARAIAAGIMTALRTRENVVFLGEEVGNPGGLLGQAGLLHRDAPVPRVFNMPIAEAGFVGLACGLAMAGYRPVVELMYGSFALVAADQLFNHIGSMRALYGGRASAPVVVRAKMPYGRGYGPQHALNPASLFASFPGWRIVAPADPREWVGAFNAALDGQDPVLIIEFSDLYDREFDLSEDDQSGVLPLTGHRLLRAGRDATILTYGLGVGWSLEAAARLESSGIDVSVVDLRVLDTPGLDVSGLRASVDSTGLGLVVDPASRSQSIAPRLVAEIGWGAHRRMESLACADVHPAARDLEAQALIGVDDIVTKVLGMLGEPSSGRQMIERISSEHTCGCTTAQPGVASDAPTKPAIP